eukprot:489446-Amphidinium_carterae.1
MPKLRGIATLHNRRTCILDLIHPKWYTPFPNATASKADSFTAEVIVTSSASAVLAEVEVCLLEHQAIYVLCILA